MDRALRSCLWLWLCISLTMASLCAAKEKIVKVENKCSFTVWPGIETSFSGEKVPDGFQPLLNSGESFSITFPREWEGGIWGRLGCTFNQSERGSCHSGDCGGYLRCEKAPFAQKKSTPTSQVVLNYELYSVNLEQGYNLPLSVSTDVKTCGTQVCSAYVGDVCPTNLQMKLGNEVIACSGSCDSYLAHCSPPEFESAFKKTCPDVVPFQDTSVCESATTYTITFCPA